MSEAMAQAITNIEQGAKTALIDASYASNPVYKPQFILNDYKTGQKVLSSLEDELANCEAFYISVAFITMGGITPLLPILKELESKGVQGKILTTDYLTFSEPKALEKLASMQNIELKMFASDKVGFHTKGYIFKQTDCYSIITGSANMTKNALTTNREWNTKLITTPEGEYAKHVLEEFQSLWNAEEALTYASFIENYRVKYAQVKEQKRIAAQMPVVELAQYRLEPNSMQTAFIQSLTTLRENGAKRALLISATGTGKTYASAFAMRDANQQRVLFIVHREQILRQAKKSYERVFGKTKTFGLLSGSVKEKDYDADYLFAMMNTVSQSKTLEQFKPDDFDMIIIDEVHHAGAESYQRIMNYFKPKFWLGMTATPERMDGYDVYGLFDHNIAYEIRLQDALEEDLLCPFHYFGITELEVDGHVLDDNTSFQHLVCDERINHVIQQAEYYGYSGNRVKGLIFCSRVEEALELSKKFNERGYRTVALSGSDNEERRSAYIERLAKDNGDDCLDYIFTVDIFNEGVDIPEINQVIMLRPTQSPVIFVQQLGRGLRKADDKEYVVILDFIGNYTKNFMIPIALSGDRSYNKDTIRKYVREGSRVIPGSSTVHFDEIAKKNIYDAISQTTITNTMKFLKEKYISLKNKLGKTPTILDFYEYGEIDPMLFIEKKRTYDNFVREVDSDYTTVFIPEDELMLDFVSNNLINGKRPHELLMLQLLMEQQTFTKDEFKSRLALLGELFRDADYDSAINVLTLQFINTPSDKTRYGALQIMDTDQFIKERMNLVGTMYQKMNQESFKEELSNLIQYGLRVYQDNYKNHDADNLVLYQKYSRKDVCRLLNWDKDESATIYGYRIKHDTCPIFVTYEKKDDISSSTKYEDQFVNEQLFSWMTRSRVSLHSAESQNIIHYKENGLKLYLFVKKSDGEGTDFYYMGQVHPVAYQQTVIENDKGQELPIMNFQMELAHAVRSDIYEYFVN